MTTSHKDQDTVWYLAYGSNMDPSVLTGRRKITPIESVAVKVPDYWLSFDIAGVPFVEPCFGSILKKDKSRLDDREYAYEVYTRTRYGTEFRWDPKNPEASYPPDLQGVIHRITVADWQQVIRTEGGWGHDIPTGYDMIDVECFPYSTKGRDTTTNTIDFSRSVMAKVLIARPLSIRSHCQPTARYLGLLTTGAEIHGLEPSYQNYLSSLVPYECTGKLTKVGRALFVLFSAPIVLGFTFVFSRQKRMAKRPRSEQTPPPYWMAWYIDKASRWSATVHDYIMAPIFGSGRCSTPEHQRVLRMRIAEKQKEKALSWKRSTELVRKEIEEDEPRVVQATEEALEGLAA
ncbi:hypothetical protein BGZ73_005148 [Actinomortierella ambigua]|nr:hypothetical protein BGZ73_005148 [Actinomortierella ambigua]